jgi:hypothetical protein
MGSWQEVCAIGSRFGARQMNDTAWLFELQGDDEGSLQKVFVFYELMQPDFEFLQIKSAFASIREVDAEAAIKKLGQLQVGGIGYAPFRASDGSQADGMLTITTSIPLRSFDLSDPTTFMLYLHILARAANNSGRSFSSTGPAIANHGQGTRPPSMPAASPGQTDRTAYRAAPAEPAQVQDDKEWARHLAEEYGRACTAVMGTLEAALAVANEANNAQGMEQEFGPLYHAFGNARAHAEEVGNKLVNACQQQDPERWLMLTLNPESYSVAGAAIEYMRAVSGSTPRVFLEGIGQGTNSINSSPNFGEPGFRGYIYHDAVRETLNQI